MRFTHQPGAQPLAGYTIQRGIHRGGFGEVYYARSDGGKEVALKLLQRDQDVELRGVRQCLNLKHPNLVNLFDVRTDGDGEQWVVMEYVNGTSLEDVLESFPNGLSIDEVTEWFSGIVAGVQYLHDRGIVHRDLKPANVYRENGTVKVGDVGLSKRLGSDRRGAHTQSVGTVYYMAPEVGHGQYGPEVDVYSLGIMLYEMLTGRVPFGGETTAEVLMKHLTSMPQLHGIPEKVRPVIQRALAKDPAHRTSTAVQLEQEWREALSHVKTGKFHPVREHAWVPAGDSESPSRSLSETPSTAHVKVETSARMATPVSTRTPAQAASAYAQNPPPIPLTTPMAQQGQMPRDGVATPTAPKVRQTESRSPGRSSGRKKTGRSHFNWPLMAALLIGLGLFAPGTWRSWAGLGMIGAAFGAASVMRGRNGSRLDTSLVSVDPAVDVQLCTKSSESEQAFGDTAAMLTVGSVAATLLPMGTILSTEFFRRHPHPPEPEFLAMATATSLLATWLIVLTSRLSRQFAILRRHPRKVYLLVGLLTGALAYGLDQYLLVDLHTKLGSAAFNSIGVHRLMDSDMSPTWLGYSIFFGGILFWHRWWQDLSPRRSRPVSVGRLCTAGFAAWLLTVFFAFPQWPAVVWVVATSAAVQLASPVASRRIA